MIVWLIAMNVVALSRLFTFRSDKPAGGVRIAVAAVVQMACLAFFVRCDAPGGLLLVLTLGAGLVPLLSEWSTWHVHWRTFVIVAYGTVIAFPLCDGRPQLSAERVGAVAEFLRASLFVRFGDALNAEYTLAMGLGLLLCLEEANMLLRVVLKTLDVSPPAKPAPPPDLGPKALGPRLVALVPAAPPPAAPPDAGTYLRGGLVGSIERLLIFVFVMHESYNAISFVIAAKTIARFNEMTKNASTEYILIGTLLSTLVAIALGLAALQFKTGI